MSDERDRRRKAITGAVPREIRGLCANWLAFAGTLEGGDLDMAAVPAMALSAFDSSDQTRAGVVLMTVLIKIAADVIANGPEVTLEAVDPADNERAQAKLTESILYDLTEAP